MSIWTCKPAKRSSSVVKQAGKSTVGSALSISSNFDGSGKSTLVMALLILCQVQRGSIRVDGVEISQASPSVIRRRCFIAVPQDAFNQPDESLRNNLDPLEHHSTQEIKQALQKLHLWSHFQIAGSGLGNDDEASRVLALPLSFFPPLSEGQTQLLSLACAILKARYQVTKGQKPIILLDEPAANLDDEYESLSSRIIEEEFTEKGHTVLMITHSSKDLKERVRPGKDIVVRVSNGTMSVVAAGE
jgi:ATP-binding cassette subfamily C (CFTR/MRP) protein 1